ncbi:MAG TPA: NAD(P)-dependent oxidoreductase [Actinomycetota bacterium]
MNVFVAGATGAIGRRLLPLLLQGGHEVTGMTRSPERARTIEEAGARAVVCDALDAQGVKAAVAAATPDAVIHQLTSIPPALDPRRYDQQMATNDFLRTEGTRNLVEAAKAVGVRRVVAQSIAFAYAPIGPGPKREEDPLFLDAPHPFRRSVLAIRDLEDAVTHTDGIDGVVLRYGFFYGPGTAFARDGSMAETVRRRRLPIVGGGRGVYSFVELGDAASATVAALTSPPGTYNVVDDDPAPVREWIPYYARVLGVKPPLRVPAFVGRIAGGPLAAYYMTMVQGASNERARRELGWTPGYPSWRQGFRESLG